jgi:hypothetical protein
MGPFVYGSTKLGTTPGGGSAAGVDGVIVVPEEAIAKKERCDDGARMKSWRSPYDAKKTLILMKKKMSKNLMEDLPS